MSFGEIHASVFPASVFDQAFVPYSRPYVKHPPGTGPGPGDPEMDEVTSCPPRIDGQGQIHATEDNARGPGAGWSMGALREGRGYDIVIYNKKYVFGLYSISGAELLKTLEFPK